MKAQETGRTGLLKAKKEKEIQEMVDELERQIEIANEEEAEGLERHRQEWFQKGHEHGLLIKKKYGIAGSDMEAV